MLSEARGYLNIAWWTATFPGVAIALMVLAANCMGDSLRDRLDPTLRNKSYASAPMVPRPLRCSSRRGAIVTDVATWEQRAWTVPFG
jgi:hypothetical protein